MNGRPTRYAPMVPSPRLANGGGAARPMGAGGPGIAPPGSSRAELLAQQVADNERGRFTERVFAFPQFDPLAPGGIGISGTSQSQQIQVTTNRSSFVRLVACRGILQFSDSDLNGLEAANLLFKLSINGEEELTTSGNVGGFASFAAMFSSSAAPWFWFASPPRLRNGDTVQCTVVNNLAEGSTLTPEFLLRLVDDQWWQAVYGVMGGC